MKPPSPARRGAGWSYFFKLLPWLVESLLLVVGPVFFGQRPVFLASLVVAIPPPAFLAPVQVAAILLRIIPLAPGFPISTIFMAGCSRCAVAAFHCPVTLAMPSALSPVSAGRSSQCGFAYREDCQSRHHACQEPFHRILLL